MVKKKKKKRVRIYFTFSFAAAGNLILALSFVVFFNYYCVFLLHQKIKLKIKTTRISKHGVTQQVFKIESN